MRSRIAPLAAVLVVVVALVAGCAALDRLFTPNAETGTSPVQDVGTSIANATDGSIAGPYSEIALSALLLVQNGYLLVRKLQKKIATSKTEDEAA